MSRSDQRPDGVPLAQGLLDLLQGHFPGHTMQRMRLPDGRYRYTYVSPGVRETFGLDPEALLGATSVGHEWLPEPDRTRFVEALERSAATLETLDMEVRVRRPDGTLRWVRSIGHPRRLADGSVVWDGVALDVTDRHEARAALDAALDAARRREASGSGLSAVALRDLARPMARLREALKALPPRSSGVPLQRLEELEAALASAVALMQAAGSSAEAPPALPEQPAPGLEATSGLTQRQREILGLLRQGLPNREIATQLRIGEGTVKLHVSAIMRRLGARNRTEAALRRDAGPPTTGWR
ncbi:LuxR C-terminal-related transcriptional regulator [Falsiroseomonas sp. HW251]|uniref:LuxR C-terminal-related transcriptional regulator n=1 Tax=Falsiroseomonas sp. HW251 TaxID=3390998 RepID=UPI003D3146CD